MKDYWKVLQPVAVELDVSLRRYEVQIPVQLISEDGPKKELLYVVYVDRHTGQVYASLKETRSYEFTTPFLAQDVDK